VIESDQIVIKLGCILKRVGLAGTKTLDYARCKRDALPTELTALLIIHQKNTTALYFLALFRQ